VKPMYAIAALLVVSLVLLASPAEATHFRYGSLAYVRPDPVNQPLLVRFTLTLAWRPAFPDDAAIDFGDGVGSPTSAGTSMSPALDVPSSPFSYWGYTFDHVYAAAGTYTAYFSGCCRASNLLNAGDDVFVVTAKVDVGPGNTGGPATLVPAIVPLQVGGVRSFFVPGLDPDGDLPACRFATGDEAGISSASMPPVVAGTGQAPTVTASASPPGCMVTWDLNGAPSGDFYALQVVIETTHAGVLSHAVADFGVETVATPPPSCNGSGVFPAFVGAPLSAIVTGVSNDPGQTTLTNALVASVGGLVPADGTTQASPFSSTFEWTPGLLDTGVHLALVRYADAIASNGWCWLGTTVTGCPQALTPCSVGAGQCASEGVFQCAGPDSAVCSATPLPPQPEACDGLDDDCDGVVDNGFSLDQVCTAGVGACQAKGAFVCDGAGGVACSAVPGAPAAEVCNGIDDDCNGAVDDGISCGGAGGAGGSPNDGNGDPGCACSAPGGAQSDLGSWLAAGLVAAALARRRLEKRA
jgi:MYXO-CTERM domain-containing protein